MLISFYHAQVLFIAHTMVTITFVGDNKCAPKEEFLEVSRKGGAENEEEDNKFIFNGKSMTELTYVDLCDYEFDTVDDVEDCYNRLSLAVGFFVRRNEKRKNEYEETIVRRWVCSK